MILVIVECHTLDDMIAEPETDIGVRLYIAQRCNRGAADTDPPHGTKSGEGDRISSGVRLLIQVQLNPCR
jgi:hypothetical protein